MGYIPDQWDIRYTAVRIDYTCTCKYGISESVLQLPLARPSDGGALKLKQRIRKVAKSAKVCQHRANHRCDHVTSSLCDHVTM